MSITRNYQNAAEIALVLHENILSSNKKILKKYMRLVYICRYILNVPVKNFPIDPRLFQGAPDAYVSDFEYSSILSHPTRLFTQTRVFESYDEYVPNPLIVDIESRLTNLICEGQSVYDATTQTLMSYQQKIWSVNILRKALESGDIIMYFKGSMAHRAILMSLVRSMEAMCELEKYYPAIGDNDFEVLINPRLKNYEVVSQTLRSVTRKFMLDSATRIELFYKLSECESVKRLKEGNCFVKLNNYEYQVFEAVRNDMTVSKDLNCSVVTVHPWYHNIYYTFNDSLTFTNALNQTAMFDLHRFKYALQVGQKTFGSELIDICIPHPSDYKLKSTDFRMFNAALIRI